MKALGLLFLCASVAIAQKLTPQTQQKMCSISTVFVEGKNETAIGVRNAIEGETWLSLKPESEAESILDVTEQHLEPFGVGVRGTLSIRDPEEFLWSKEVLTKKGDGPKRLLQRLTKDAACVKTPPPPGK